MAEMCYVALTVRKLFWEFGLHVPRLTGSLTQRGKTSDDLSSLFVRSLSLQLFLSSETCSGQIQMSSHELIDIGH